MLATVAIQAALNSLSATGTSPALPAFAEVEEVVFVVVQDAVKSKQQLMLRMRKEDNIDSGLQYEF
jgi:fructose-specific phosphotransferase system component IIB